jgi:hypothetical protein
MVIQFILISSFAYCASKVFMKDSTTCCPMALLTKIRCIGIESLLGA